MDIIAQLEKEQVAVVAAQRAVPEFGPGDTVIVNVKVKEGERSRVQAYEGVCIARSGGGINENFTVRKMSYGEGVERVFPIYSPMIDSIKVVRRGKVRRAKLYYLRGRTGKSARIAEKQKAMGLAPPLPRRPPTDRHASARKFCEGAGTIPALFFLCLLVNTSAMPAALDRRVNAQRNSRAGRPDAARRAGACREKNAGDRRLPRKRLPAAWAVLVVALALLFVLVSAVGLHRLEQL